MRNLTLLLFMILCSSIYAKANLNYESIIHKQSNSKSFTEVQNATCSPSTIDASCYAKIYKNGRHVHTVYAKAGSMGDCYVKVYYKAQYWINNQPVMAVLIWDDPANNNSQMPEKVVSLP